MFNQGRFELLRQDFFVNISIVVPLGSPWLLLLLIYTSPSTSLNPGPRKRSTTAKANLAQPHRPPRQISTTNRCQTRPKRWPTWSPIVSKTWVHFPGIVSPRPHRIGVPAAPRRERMRRRTRGQKKRRAQHLTTMMMKMMMKRRRVQKNRLEGQRQSAVPTLFKFQVPSLLWRKCSQQPPDPLPAVPAAVLALTGPLIIITVVIIVTMIIVILLMIIFTIVMIITIITKLVTTIIANIFVNSTSNSSGSFKTFLKSLLCRKGICSTAPTTRVQIYLSKVQKYFSKGTLYFSKAFYAQREFDPTPPNTRVQIHFQWQFLQPLGNWGRKLKGIISTAITNQYQDHHHHRQHDNRQHHCQQCHHHHQQGHPRQQHEPLLHPHSHVNHHYIQPGN